MNKPQPPAQDASAVESPDHTADTGKMVDTPNASKPYPRTLAEGEEEKLKELADACRAVRKYEDDKSFLRFYDALDNLPDWLKETENQPPVCRRCKAPMQVGQALIPVPIVSPDFGGDEDLRGCTVNPGPGKLGECWKCPKCGHSVSKEME